MGLESLLKLCRENGTFIYGDGKIGRLVRVFLEEKGITPLGFVVTSIPNASSLMNIPIYAFNDLRNKKNTVIIICVHQKDRISLFEKVTNAGYKNAFIVNDEIYEKMVSSVEYKHVYKDAGFGKKLCTLMYHRVGDFHDPYNLCVTKENFEAQLAYIKENYQVIGTEDDWSNVTVKTVMLTFDDGYVDFYQNAYPLLKKYNIPATVFITTGNINSTREFWWDELERIIYTAPIAKDISVSGHVLEASEFSDRLELIKKLREIVIANEYKERDKAIVSLNEQLGNVSQDREFYRTMNANEILEISRDPLITIGAHTISHILCDKENDDVLTVELKESKRELEEIIGKTVNVFAFPNGNKDKRTVEVLKRLGYRRAFTTVDACMGNCHDDYDIPRCIISNWAKEDNEKRFRILWQTSKLL